MTARLGARPIVAPWGPVSGALVRLFLTSATLLFVELFLIRWIPANVIYIGFFTNLILIASFLGIGTGIVLGRRASTPLLAPFPILLFVVVKLVSVAQLNVTLGSTDDIIIGGRGSAASADANTLVLICVFALVTAVMASLALPLGGLLRSTTPLRAYATDIAGSLAGIAAFTILSFLGIGPVGWTLVLGALVLLLGGPRDHPWSAVSVAAIVSCLTVVGASTDVWSPYQRLTVWQTDGRSSSAPRASRTSRSRRRPGRPASSSADR
jgi:hypothetical protein